VYSILFLEEQRYVLGGVLFAVLLNMKHLFAYLGPVYFVFLLKHYVLTDGNGSRAARTRSSSPGWLAAAGRLALLGGAVVAVCAASLGPFVAMGQMGQVRLCATPRPTCTPCSIVASMRCRQPALSRPGAVAWHPC
jgi:alpha-1,3-glucosyltransferase